MNDPRTEWQKRMGVGERQPPLPQGDTRSTSVITDTDCLKETVEHADGRVDNFYTLPTQEVNISCQPE